MAGMNMQQMMKQARKMQEQLAVAQDNLAQTTVEASAGGGMVKVTVNGGMQLESITIDPDAVDPEDVEMLQDMIVAAVNEGIRQITEIAAGSTSRGCRSSAPSTTVVAAASSRGTSPARCGPHSFPRQTIQVRA